MSVSSAYIRTCNQIGICLGWGLVGVALGGAAGCAAAQALGVKQAAGIIFGAASGSSSLLAFQKCNLTNRVSYCCAVLPAAAAGLTIGTAVGYGALALAEEAPPPETFFKLAGITYGLGLTAFLCMRALCQPRNAPPEAPPSQPLQEEYRHLPEPQ